MVDSVPCDYFAVTTPKKVTMGKSTHFSGQPLYSQVIKFMSKDRILQLSREHGGERYIKRFDCWTHLVVMLYAVIMRFDSLREIAASLQGEARKLSHLGISMMPSRSTLSDANSRRPDAVFEVIKKLSSTCESSLYVGDSDVDIQTARNAGVDWFILHVDCAVEVDIQPHLGVDDNGGQQKEEAGDEFAGGEFYHGFRNPFLVSSRVEISSAMRSGSSA